MPAVFDNTSTVYGPVTSWRFGRSLGIDPIFITSICSFNCVYCQLGEIQKVTNEVKEYVSTQKVIEDFKKLNLQNPDFDVITYSGSGEPSLALNLGEIIDEIKKIAPNKKQIILSNATTLHDQRVVKNLLKLDRVILKLDATNNQMLQKMNRPAVGITFESILEGILNLKKIYSGPVDIQTMFMPINLSEAIELAKVLNQIQPDTVQLNTPKRPYPLSWQRENRGNHEAKANQNFRTLKILTKNEANEVEMILRQNTNLNILSVYRE